MTFYIATTNAFSTSSVPLVWATFATTTFSGDVVDTFSSLDSLSFTTNGGGVRMAHPVRLLRDLISDHPLAVRAFLFGAVLTAGFFNGEDSLGLINFGITPAVAGMGELLHELFDGNVYRKRLEALGEQLLTRLEKVGQSTGSSNWKPLSDKIDSEFAKAANKVEFMKALNRILQHKAEVEPVIIQAISAFCSRHLDDNDRDVKIYARTVLFRCFEIAPKPVRKFLLDSWPLVGEFQEIVACFNKEVPGKIARLDRGLSVSEARSLAMLSYEVALVRIDRCDFLVRGDRYEVCCPAGAKIIFHTHPRGNLRSIFPSRSISSDYLYDQEIGEFGAIISLRGVMFYSGESWSRDSLKPFEERILKMIKGGAEIVGGRLFYHADWKDRVIPMIFISWDAFGELKLLPEHGGLDADAQNLLNGRPSAVALMRQSEVGDRISVAKPKDWALTSEEGATIHPESWQYGMRETGQYILKAFRPRKK